MADETGQDALIAKALKARERMYLEAIERVRELATSATEDEIHDLTFGLREAITLVGCLRRMTQGRTVAEVHQAFGAPGDFGYENPIGAALALIYRGEVCNG